MFEKKVIDLDKTIYYKTKDLIKSVKRIQDHTEKSVVTYSIDEADVAIFTEEIKGYFNKYVAKLCNERQINEADGISSILDEPVENLLYEFNVSEYYNNHIDTYNMMDLPILYRDKEDIREQILNIVLYELVCDYGNERGFERAQLVSKIFPICSSGINELTNYINMESQKQYIKTKSR